MLDIAMAVPSVFLMQSPSFLANTSGVSERPGSAGVPPASGPKAHRCFPGTRASRPHPAGGRQWTTRRRPTGVSKRARCPRS